jgi:hypothetical protein
MVLVLELGLMSSPNTSFHWEFKEAPTRVSLKTYAPDNLAVFSARLVF